MSGVQAETELLRKAGRDTVAAAEELVSIRTDPVSAVDGETVNLSGAGDPLSVDGRTQISTGGFPPGNEARQALNEVIKRFSPVRGEIIQNAYALSSALHIVADLYTTTDHKNALDFAFVAPKAKTPKGLPFYINRKNTFASWRKKASKGRSTDTVETPKPRVETSRSTQQEPRIVKRRIPMRGEGGIARRYETIHYGENGEPTRIDIADYERDGAARFYSLTPDDDGGWKRSKEFYVGPQPPVADLNQINRVRNEELKKMMDEVTSGF